MVFEKSEWLHSSLIYVGLHQIAKMQCWEALLLISLCLVGGACGYNLDVYEMKHLLTIGPGPISADLDMSY